MLKAGQIGKRVVKIMKFVNPFISGKKAKEIFLKKKSIFSRKRKIEKIELVYIPYYLFRLMISLPEGNKEIYAVSDGIEGSFSYWNGENMEFSTRGEGAVFNFTINSHQAKEKIKDEYRSGLLFYNLKKRKTAQLSEIKEIDKFYYPYWIIYFRKKDLYDFKIIDAISGEIQGIRMRRVFLSALRNEMQNI